MCRWFVRSPESSNDEANIIHLLAASYPTQVSSPQPQLTMGKRKKSSRKPQGPKKKEPLPTSFACLFCNHEKSIIVKLDKKAGVGQLSCKVCGQSFQTGINYLSAAVDVYSDWIDACEDVKKDGGEMPGGPQISQPRDVEPRGAVSSGLADRGLEPEDDGFIINDDMAGEEAYADE